MTDPITPEPSPPLDPQRTFLRALTGCTPTAEHLEQDAPDAAVDAGRQFLRNLLGRSRA